MVTAPLTSRSEMDYWQSGYADDSKPSLDGFDSCVVHNKFRKMIEIQYVYTGFENSATAEHLRKNEVCKVIGIGNSMTPILKSRQPVICVPVDENTELCKKDIVFCKVNGHFYLHLIHSVKDGDRYLIGNNHGHMNGTISRNQIYGKVVKIL